MNRKWKLLLLNCGTAGGLTFFTSIGTAMALLPSEIPLIIKVMIATGNAGALAAVTFLTTFRACMGFDKDEKGREPQESERSRVMSLCEFEQEKDSHPRGKKKTIREMINLCPPFAFFV